MPQKQKATRIFFVKPKASRSENEGADLAFDEACQEIRERF